MVGVLDTGIQASHPDLVNRISSAGLHRDCTVNPIKEPTSLTDPNGHGTHVAGIIGAQGNNGLGVAGVAWNVRLVSLRVFDANGNGNTGNITRAINFAASKNIPILNFSGGANGSDPNMQNAINGYKGLFVTAAGNDNRDVDTAPFFPSDYANTTNVAYNAFSNRVISVGSIASNGTRSSFSNYSNSGNGVTIYAPGTKILSTFPTDLCPSNCGFLPSIFNSEHHANGYHYLQGTSMATPMVAGVAALLMSHNSSLTAVQLKDAIVAGATEITISIPNPSGGGNVERNVLQLNASNALKKVAYKTMLIGNDEIRIDGTYFIPTGSLTIPEKLNGRTVTQLANSAFENCTSLTGVTLSNSLTSIGSFAFKGCASLSSITMPDSITNIGQNAFENCTSLTNITLSNTLTSIGSSAFKGCTSLSSITIPDSVTSIGVKAFENCTSLISITIPNSITDIGHNAFENCTSLTNITLSDNLTSIGNSAFKGCTRLSNISIPNTVTYIDSKAFENCTSLTSVTLSKNLIDIGSSTFKGCESLITIAIPDSVASIGANSFENCTRLTSVTLPNSLISITDHLFFNCSELSNLAIPSSVTNIGAGAFSGCSSLTSITIPKSVTNIDLYAFENCLNLKSVTVQREFVDAITILGTNVFDGCSSLKGIIVPINSTNDYKNATNWSFYSAIICCYEQHDYTYLLDSNNHDQHIGKCDCGHTHISNHNYNSFGICIDCGYEHEHTYTYSTGINDDGSFYHTKYCYGCGYSIDEPHTFVNGVCECGFHENTVETVWQEGAVISSGSSITLSKARTDYQLVKLYTVDFGEIYVNVGFTTTILLLGGEEYGVPFEQLRIDLFEDGMVLYFDIVQIEEGYEYPYPYVWSEYPFYLNKVEFLG